MAETLYQAIGGAAACRRLSVVFYAGVDRDPLLRPLFPGKTHKCAIEEFSAFLCQFLGGPSDDTQRRWWVSLHESHQRFHIGGEQRTAWMNNMARALDDAEIGEPARTALRGFFEQSSAYVVNQRASDIEDQELAGRWKVQLALDEAVASIRKGDADRAIRLAESPLLLNHSRSAIAGLLATMLGSRHEKLLAYVRERITRDPAIVHERHAGRTLLHDAAALGDFTTVGLLLGMGADVNAVQGTGHTPLYCLANECMVAGGDDIVRLLVKHGAKVNADGGVKHCTPLHMAARRGNVEIAAALLDCGANIEARDNLGVTPLRRAVNCKKTGVASFLYARGARK